MILKKGEEEEEKKTFWNSSTGILLVNQVFVPFHRKVSTQLEG